MCFAPIRANPPSGTTLALQNNRWTNRYCPLFAAGSLASHRQRAEPVDAELQCGHVLLVTWSHGCVKPTYTPSGRVVAVDDISAPARKPWTTQCTLVDRNRSSTSRWTLSYRGAVQTWIHRGFAIRVCRHRVGHNHVTIHSGATPAIFFEPAQYFGSAHIQADEPCTWRQHSMLRHDRCCHHRERRLCTIFYGIATCSAEPSSVSYYKAVNLLH